MIYTACSHAQFVAICIEFVDKFGNLNLAHANEYLDEYKSDEEYVLLDYGGWSHKVR